MVKPTILLGLLGQAVDGGLDEARWERWRPTVSLFQQEDLVIDRLELLVQRSEHRLAKVVEEDIAALSPETEIRRHQVHFDDPWDFAEVYAVLRDFADGLAFDAEREDYLVHITTGTHVAQICMFLLTETRHLPARLVQTAPPRRKRKAGPGEYAIIDLDLSRYDQLAARFAAEREGTISFLKAGIETRSATFNERIDEIERVAIRSTAPILLTGPTGVGKTRLAHRIYELRKRQHLVAGGFVEVNCATLRGDQAMSALFGHERGAFTGALERRDGLLRAADGGLLFLDEVGELGLDEQAMLLRALEEGTFLPLGSDAPASSSFQLICGTNRNLAERVRDGEFREDLLARIDLWTFSLPALRERLEDVEPNLEYELERYARDTGRRVTFNREARARFLDFATAPTSTWKANFRDFSAALTRMATLAPGGRINAEVVAAETERLRGQWRDLEPSRGSDAIVEEVLRDRAAELDRFDRVQLAEVLHQCRAARSMSAAGRELFAQSRARKKSKNDADRLAKYLARFGLTWTDVRE